MSGCVYGFAYWQSLGTRNRSKAPPDVANTQCLTKGAQLKNWYMDSIYEEL